MRSPPGGQLRDEPPRDRRHQRLRRGAARTIRVRVAPLLHGVPLLPAQVPAPHAAGALRGAAAGDGAAPGLQRDVRGEPAHRGRVRARLPARPARGSGARRLHRRDLRDRAGLRRALARAGRGHLLRPPAEPAGVQGGRARERAPPGEGRVRGGLRRRLRPGAGLPAPHGPVLHGPQDRDGAGALGAPQPRLQRAHAVPGHPARRPLRHRAHRAQPLRRLLQLQRHRRHLAARDHPTTPAAGSTTRSPRTSTSPTAPSWRAGTSSSCRT